MDRMTARAVTLVALVVLAPSILVGTGLFILAFRAMSLTTFYLWPRDRHE
jgi:hypothetical protein